MDCVHPKDSQVFVRRDPHWAMGHVDVYECHQCGRESRRLVLNDKTVADLELEGFKASAQTMCFRAVQAGLLERPATCEKCGNEDDIQAHHYDYSRPLEVEWLCRKCHSAADEVRRRSEAA